MDLFVEKKGEILETVLSNDVAACLALSIAIEVSLVE